MRRPRGAATVCGSHRGGTLAIQQPQRTMVDLETVTTDLHPPDACALDVELTRPIAPTQHNARVAQPPLSRRPLPWLDIGVVLLCALVVPCAVYLDIALVSAHLLGALFIAVATAYAVTGLAVTLETAVALPRKYSTRATQAPGKGFG